MLGVAQFGDPAELDRFQLVVDLEPVCLEGLHQRNGIAVLGGALKPKENRTCAVVKGGGVHARLEVPSEVYERRRVLVRGAVLVRARGRLERREGAVNVLVAELCEPSLRTELRAVAPAGHSFGRR